MFVFIIYLRHFSGHKGYCRRMPPVATGLTAKHILFQ